MHRRRGDLRAFASLVLAMIALVCGLAIVLAHAEQRRAGTNGVWVQGQTPVRAGTRACQQGELLPAGAGSIQIPGSARRPPTVMLRRSGHVLARAQATVDARRELISAPIAPPSHDLAGVEICLRARSDLVLFVGPTPPRLGSIASGGGTAYSMAVSYLLPGARSWWSHAPAIAAHSCGGHGGWDPCWTVWAVAALVAASLLLTAIVVLRTLILDRPMPRLAVAVAAVAALNAAAWSFITPPFQVPDEVAHVAYAQSIGETAAPPADPRSIVMSREQLTAMGDSGFGGVFSRTLHAGAWSPLQQHRLAVDLRRPWTRSPTIYAGEGEPEPPLYYALEAIAYRAAHGGTLLDRLIVMRLLSASLAGITALLACLFVRECLPARPWAWAVGGLGVAFTPMLGFISGGVNPDGLLFALSAALFLCVARAWRRGVTRRLALVIGALVAAGMLTKVNFYGLVPGALLGFALAARRSVGAWDRRVVALLSCAAGLAAAGFALGIAVETLVWHRPLAVGRPANATSHVGLLGHLDYIWQVFLPRLPFQGHTTLTHPGYVQLFETFVGAFGWVTVWMPTWAYQLALGSAIVIGLLALRMLHAEPRELRWRRGETIGYGAMTAALLLLIGLSADLRREILHIVQGRYLLPLLPLFGLLLTLGVRGAGERWGRAVGVLVVCGAVAWTVSGQLVTVAFFYS